MAFVISGTGERTAEAYEGGAGWPATLRVEYTVAVPALGVAGRAVLVLAFAGIGAAASFRYRVR